MNFERKRVISGHFVTRDILTLLTKVKIINKTYPKNSKYDFSALYFAPPLLPTSSFREFVPCNFYSTGDGRT